MKQSRRKTFLLIQVGGILREAREEAAITGPQVVEAELVTGASQLSRLESGYGVTLTPRAIGQLCDFYRMSQTDKFMAQQMYRKAKEEDDAEWLEPFSQVMFRDISLLFTLEQKASRLSIYDNLAHGLFQTRSYAKALHQDDKPDVAEKRIELRMQRQRDFWRSNSHRRVRLLIPEHALLGACPREQVDHLIELDQQPGVTIRYLPTEHGPRPNLPGKFTVIEFDGPDPDVVYSESISGARYEHRKVAVEAHLAVFDHELDLARPIKEFRRGRQRVAEIQPQWEPGERLRRGSSSRQEVPSPRQ